MIELHRRSKSIGEINMVPLINVVFLLLIFFMVAGSIERTVLLPIDFPKADGGEYLEEGPIEIVLGKHDEVVINNELVSMEGLGSSLVTALDRDRYAIITIKADQNLPAERLIKIMTMIKRAGGVNVSLVTQSS